MVGTWKLLKSVAVGSGGADSIDTGELGSYDFLKVSVYLIPSGGNIHGYMYFNGDGTSTGNYARRGCSNGGSGSSSGDFEVSPDDEINFTNQVNETCSAFFAIANPASETGKQITGWEQEDGGSDNTTSPDRFEWNFKYKTTGRITSIQVKNNLSGSSNFAEHSYITVWGVSGDTVTDEKATLADATGLQDVAVTPSFHYKFSEASGDVVNHGSVASADLTVTSLTRDQSTPSGIGNGMKTVAMNTGYAQNTSRINDYKFMHDGTSKWSVTFWLKASGVPTNSDATEKMIFGNIWTDDNGIGFAIRLAKNSDNSSSKARIQTLIADGNSGMPLNDQSADDMMPDTSNWHFYCVTYDPTLSSNNLTVTRDASTSGDGFHQGDEDNDTYSSSNPTRKCVYFARPTSNLDMGVEGTLAQVIIYKDIILTQANKVSLYASGNGTTTLPSVTSEQTVSLAPPVGTRYEETDTRKIYRRVGALTSSDADHSFDFSSSSGWTLDTHHTISSGTLNFSSDQYLDGVRATYDLGTALSDTWVLRWKWSFTTLSLPNDSNYKWHFGISNTASKNSSSHDWITANIDLRNSSGYQERKMEATVSDDQTHQSGDFEDSYDMKYHITNSWSGTDYYCELIRDGTTTGSFTFNVRSGSHSGTLLNSSKNSTSTKNPTGLKYIWSGIDDYSGAGRSPLQWAGTIDNIEIYDGVTSLDASWKERGTA